MLIIQIALGILVGYLLIRFLPVLGVCMSWLWSLKYKIFFAISTIVAYGIFFMIGINEGFKSPEVLSAGLIGLFSLFMSLYLFDDQEDENRSIKGFVSWFRKQ